MTSETTGKRRRKKKKKIRNENIKIFEKIFGSLEKRVTFAVP